MKKIILFLFLILGLSLTGYAIYRLSNSTRVKIIFMKSKMEERTYEPVLGIYDRNNSLNQTTPEDFQHFALILNNDKKWDINQNLMESLPLDAPVILTVEMWDIGVLGKTIRGEYDKNIAQLFLPILKGRTNVFLRWSPEMDVPANELPWAVNPAIFIQSFQKFSAEINKISPATRMVFAPAGYPGVLENYPGKEVVNASSITLNSDSETNMDNYKQDILPAQIRRKLHRLRFIDHPILVFGSRNFDLDSFKKTWITSAFDTIRKNSDIIYSEENFKHPQSLPLGKNQNFILGFYEPEASLLNEKEVSAEHIFLDFTGVENGSFKNILEKALTRNNDLILTMEPGISHHKIIDPDVLKNILNGNYDDVITQFYSILSNVDRKIYLRFAHEMEIPIDRYAWQSKDPLEYIRAFRYFMQFPGSEIDNIERVWGPAGDRGSIEYWPGNDVVDYKSISVYGLPDKNITDPEKQESFAKIFIRKSWRLRFIDKPIFITEFGVKGEDEFQAHWLAGAAETLNEEPKVIGVNYFNMTDVPAAWGEIAPPDWSISKETFRTFVETLRRDDIHTAGNYQ